MMIKLLAKNNEYYVFAVDYYFYTVNRSTGKILPQEYLVPLLKYGAPYEYGDFTNECSKEYLEEISNKASDYNKKYIEDLVNIGELSRNEVMPYMIKRYEQILANFNLAIGKQVYKNVKYDPDWIDDLEGL